MRILFSLECFMTASDVSKEMSKAPYSEKFKMKNFWYQEFKKKLIVFINEQDRNSGGCTAINDTREWLIEAIVKENNECENNLWKYLIMLECTLFVPYFPLYEGENSADNKLFKGLKYSDKSREEALRTISAWLGINYQFVIDCQKTYERAIKKMNGYWNKVLIGVGAGIVASLLVVATMGGSIVAFFAASGLYGAAAVSSGLAALGGGAIAAGGFGMAGGMAVLVGGGLLLGGGAGATLTMTLASTNPTGIMTETAKLYVVMKEIILALNHDTKRALEIISSVIDKISDLKKEITELKLKQKENAEKIKNLEKSISYLEEFLKMSK